MNGWTPGETWLLVAFLVLATALVVWCLVVRHQDRRDRPSRLAPMTVDEAHLRDLEAFQRELRADYGVPDPTPVDPSGRVWKRGTSDFDGGDAA